MMSRRRLIAPFVAALLLLAPSLVGTNTNRESEAY